MTLGAGRGLQRPKVSRGMGKGFDLALLRRFGQNGKDRGTARNASRMVCGGIELPLKA